LEGLASDLNLLFDNAKQYNREESKIYKVMTSSYVENSVVGETANDACFDGSTFYSFVGPTVFLGKFCQILHITTEFFFIFRTSHQSLILEKIVQNLAQL